MLRRQTVGRQGPRVLAGAVAFVAVESEVRIHRGELDQQAITIDLGDDRSSRYGEAERVAVNDRLLGVGQTRQGKCVNQEIIGFDGQSPNRPLQRRATSPAESEPVDLKRWDLGKPKAQSDVPDDRGEPLPSRRSKLLRVAHTGERTKQRRGWGRENDGGRDKRAGPATPPNLVDSSDGAQAQPG